LTTIKDVARRAGVSAGTVSNLLSGCRFVRPETAARIQKAMQELDYRPNALARGLRSKRSSTIGLIVPDSANPFFAEVAWHIARAAAGAGFGLMLCNTGNLPSLESAQIELLLEKRVDGIILVSGTGSAKPLENAVCARIPLVLLAREVPGVEADVLVVDNHRGGGLVASHLLGLGHRRLGYIGRESTLSPSSARLEGFQRTLMAAGVPLTEESVVSAYSRPEDGYHATLALLGRAPDITAIFAFNDIIALGVIRAAYDLGRRIPESLALVGFDDISLADLSVPRLTTVRPPVTEMGRLAVSLIAERLASQDLPPRRHVLPVELVVRESTAPPGQRAGTRGP